MTHTPTMLFTERKLGSFEALLDVSHQHSHDICMLVYILQCDETITKTKLIDATCKWAARHPLLHAAVEIRADDRYFVPISIDLVPNVVHWHDEIIEWTRLAEEDIQKPIDPCGIPLWRMHFAPLIDGRRVMLFTMNHCIMDGRSFVQIFFELLDILNGKEDQLGPPRSLQPSVEKLLFGRDVYEGDDPVLTHPWLVVGRMLPRSFIDHQVENGTTRVIPMIFGKEKTSRLLQESRRHGVKLTSTANCIASLALVELLKKYGEAVPVDFQITTAVSVRDQLKINLDEMGTYTACMICRVVLQPDMGQVREQFWDIAKAASDELHARLDRGDAVECVKGESDGLEMLLSGKYFPDCSYFFMSSLGNYCYGGTEGKSVEKPAVKMDEVHVLMSLLEDFWSPALFHGLATLNGRLFWTFGYHDRAFKSPMAHEYCQRIQRIVDWLLEIEKDDRTT